MTLVYCCLFLDIEFFITQSKMTQERLCIYYTWSTLSCLNPPLLTQSLFCCLCFQTCLSPVVYGRCIWYGQCTPDVGNGAKNCEYNGEAKPLTNVTAKATLASVCPGLYDPTKGKYTINPSLLRLPWPAYVQGCMTLLRVSIQ